MKREDYLKYLGYTKPCSHWLKPIGSRLFVYLPEVDAVVHYFYVLDTCPLPPLYPSSLGIFDVYYFDNPNKTPLITWESYQDLGILHPYTEEHFIDYTDPEETFPFDLNVPTISDLFKKAFASTNREEQFEISNYILGCMGHCREGIRLNYQEEING